MGQTGSTWRAHGRQVQRPLQGVGEGQQGVEAPGGREGECRQQGLTKASPGQRGPQGRLAAEAREAEDGLCGFCGFSFCGSEAAKQRSCVAAGTILAREMIDSKSAKDMYI